MIIKNIDELLETIKEDKSCKDISGRRFPARFILLPNYELLHILLNKISNDVNFVYITNLLQAESIDGWLTISQLSQFIKSLDLSKDYIILGLSEFLRSLDREKFFVLLNSIIEIEGGIEKKGRLYVPLIGLRNRVENEFIVRYVRRSEWDPLWIVDGDSQKIKIYFVNFELNDAFIKSSRDFLDLWKETNLSDKVVSCSKTLYWQSSFFIPDETFSFEKINNVKDYISKYLKIDIPIEYDDKENKFWEELLKFISKGRESFNDIVENILNIKTIDLLNVLELWSRGTEFSRWILKWHVLNNKDFKETYLYIVLKDLKSYKEYDLIREYWLKIFDLNVEEISQNWLEERRKVLRYFHEDNLNELPKSVEYMLIERISNLTEKEILNYLVGVSFWEKEWIIKNFDKIKNISDVYPELSYYLEDLYFENLEEDKKWVIEYFREYRWSKLKNKASENLISILGSKNKNRQSFYNWYYSFDKVKKIYYKEDAEKKVFIDGLGLEFINLFLHFLKEKGFSTRLYIGVSELPSITDYNKLPADEYIDDLDNFIHNQLNYRYPRSFVEEIEIIKKIVRYISTLGDDLLIFSDHGFTIFPHSQLEGVKRYNFEEAHHDGRCMEISNNANFVEDEDFFIHSLEIEECRAKKYIVPLKYISLKNLSKREVHGGATPEEVLVPVIYASKVAPKVDKYKIKILEYEIPIRNPILSFKISPKPKEDVVICYLNNFRNMNFDVKSGTYKLLLENIKVGRLKIKVKIGSYEEEFIINIIGGMKERDLL